MGTPASGSPISDTSTIAAAKTTDRPAVAVARAAASTTGTPARRCSRWRETRSSA